MSKDKESIKEQQSIPTSKVARASKFITTGAKVGGNYLKYFAKKAIGTDSKEELDAANAEDIYASLSQLKGSALKAAQMLSMDQNLLPKAFSEKFQLAQYSAPPLSYPLVEQTFRKQLGKKPKQIFDTFSRKAIHAASIGQVHKATLGDQTFAVKVQYPGVADSVKSDLRIAKPMAAALMNVKASALELYMEEVESKLLEETDYELELRRGNEISEQCAQLDGLSFPRYYPEYSAQRILTMDWMDGQHFKDWLATDPDQETRDSVGQIIWDFYAYQLHVLKTIHADPHPGNFLIADDQVIVLDFGCVKEIPDDFYNSYFDLVSPGTMADSDKLKPLFYKLEMLLDTDAEDESAYFFNMFHEMLSLLGQPFHDTTFDFSNKAYFDQIYTLAEKYQYDKNIRKYNAARGSKHTIYVNRTYFGLYNMLHELGAKVNTQSYIPVALTQG